MVYDKAAVERHGAVLFDDRRMIIFEIWRRTRGSEIMESFLIVGAKRSLPPAPVALHLS
ncbi:MAG: hypothetical protein ACT4NP_13765 [Pseudonocardiales bacterium]